MITHLISTTKFVQDIDSDNTIEQDKAYELIIRYTNFISQKPELWMFVPCNELNEPYPDTADEYWKHKKGYLAQHYKIAQSKVLFKGWIIDTNHDKLVIKNTITKHKIEWYDLIPNVIIEDLLQLYLELTQTTLKQIGL